MFDFGFTELIAIGVVALIVIGPERLPKVARTAGHLYGRLQRYVSTVKSDISREIQLDELKRAGQSFKESIESIGSSVEQQATVVDDYLRNEADSVKQTVLGGEGADTEPAAPEPTAQQSLPLEVAEPEAVGDRARDGGNGKQA